MELRKIKEKNFHDQLRTGYFEQRWSPELEKTIQRDPMWSNMKYYSIERKSRNMVLEWLKKECQGKRVLDYACGNGEDAIFLAKNGASEVIGIDISEVSIENCQKRAKNEGVQNNTSFLVMDAEHLEFNDDYFDLITEYGCLHHLDLIKAYAQLSRVLKPEGKIICNEALGHNPIIHFYRKLTPHLRTEWEVEHIIRKKDLELATKYFETVETSFFHLATLAAVPFRNTSRFESLLKVLEKIDDVLLKLPLVKWQAWQIVFLLSMPRKNIP